MTTSINKDMKLSEHFTLGELTKTSYHTTDGNIPSRVAIENLRNICENWLEDLRYSYNVLYGEGRQLTQVSDPSFPSCARLPVAFAESGRLHLGQTPSEPDDIPIVISSGYRSEEVNRKCGGAKGSNHLTGCAVDIRCYGPEHMIRMAGILLDIADGTKREFDELIMEQRGTTCWIHFAVRRENGPATQGAACQRKNRRKILFDCW